MTVFDFLPRRVAIAALLVCLTSVAQAAADGTQVVFDLPNTMECRDVTPCEFGELHPT